MFELNVRLECSKLKNGISTTPLNPMVFHSRYKHITEKIFVKIDMKTLKNCREVAQSWKELVDNKTILWMDEVGTNAFKLACKDGHSKLMEILLR